MPNAQHLRAQIEATLADRIPSALTPLPRGAKSVAATGVAAIDSLLQGGFPLGSITELVGPGSSGRTSLALTFIAGMTQAGKVCAWVDVSDALHPESAAALGVDLSRLLWIRCGVSSPAPVPAAKGRNQLPRSKTWFRLEQALRVTDLLLQAGGFSCIVLDMGSLSGEYVLRVPLATWFRFRAAAERLQSHVLVLTQHACAKSSASLVLRLEPQSVVNRETTIFTGLEYQAGVERQRGERETLHNVQPIRKPPQSTLGRNWQTKAAWAGR